LNNLLLVVQILVAFSVIALLGVPPLSGFWAKMMILGGLMTTGHKTVAALVLFATVVEAVYYLRFIAMIYSTAQKVKVFDSTLKFNKIVPVVLFALTIILFSLVPQFLDGFFNILSHASRELTNVGSYISAVLGS